MPSDPRREPVVISGTLVTLVPLCREYLERWREWVNDGEVAELLDRVLPVTDDEHERYYRDAVVENRHAVWFAVESNDDHEYVGNVWLWNMDSRHRRAEVRILIGESRARGRGYGAEALVLLRDHAVRKLGLHKLYAYVHVRNPSARAAFERAGFHLEATLKAEAFWDGSFRDVWRMAYLAE